MTQTPPKLTVAVLFGGASPEHDISLMSARNIIHSLDPALYQCKIFGIMKDGTWIYGDDAFNLIEQQAHSGNQAPKISAAILNELNRCDVCIPVFHGPQGEDGMFQGLLDVLSIPYVGCDYRSSAVCMQKAWTKHVAIMNGVPTASFIESDVAAWYRNPERLLESAEQQLHYPMWVKPVHLGSSIGVSRTLNREELRAAIERAFACDDYLIIEQEVVGRQIEFAVLGNDYVRVGAPGEILSHGQFYDYERKYGPHAMQTQTPADINSSQERIGKELAKRMYEACCCKGLARIDFFLDNEGYFWLNEINPFPGFTAVSLYPKMWEACGLTQRELCNELIFLALQRHRRIAGARVK